jgi:hypothetical protein
MLFVEYEVEGFEGIQTAGPYSEAEIQSQRDDIAGYEGVKNVRIVKPEDRTLNE